MDSRHILILGGTGEARALAEAFTRESSMRITLSLAGRTLAPRVQAGEVRVGGFGGWQGLVRYIRESRVDILVDATHPFAARMSENAERAADETAVPRLVLERPPWKAVRGDRWTDAESVADAARLLGASPRKVFLAIGRQELAPFREKSQHFYLVRSVDPVDPAGAPANAQYILERGPFDEAAERALLTEHRIEVVVAKNSGGEATYGKIAAARALDLPVIMVRRPRLPAQKSVSTVEEAVQGVRHLARLPAARGE